MTANPEKKDRTEKAAKLPRYRCCGKCRFFCFYEGEETGCCMNPHGLTYNPPARRACCLFEVKK